MYTGTDAIYKAFPVYRCSRGHDYLPEILYVLRCHGHSLAGIIIDYEPTARDEILERMIPACLATDGADVREEGYHQWRCWDDERQQWWPPSSFKTKVLS